MLCCLLSHRMSQPFYEAGVSNLFSQMNTCGLVRTRSCLSPHLVPTPALDPRSSAFQASSSSAVCFLTRNALVCEVGSCFLLVLNVESLIHVEKVVSFGVGPDDLLVPLDTSERPWGVGGWLRDSMSPPLLITGQRNRGSTLIPHLKKSLDFVLFSYLPLASY